jgi:hypothetical protein
MFITVFTTARQQNSFPSANVPGISPISLFVAAHSYKSLPTCVTQINATSVRLQNYKVANILNIRPFEAQL